MNIFCDICHKPIEPDDDKEPFLDEGQETTCKQCWKKYFCDQCNQPLEDARGMPGDGTCHVCANKCSH